MWSLALCSYFFVLVYFSCSILLPKFRSDPFGPRWQCQGYPAEYSATEKSWIPLWDLHHHGRPGQRSWAGLGGQLGQSYGKNRCLQVPWKETMPMPWGGGSIFLGKMFSYEPVWYTNITNCIDSLWASCWGIWRYLKFAVALCWTPRLGILFWLPCGLFCLLMTCTILRDDLSEFCDAREFPMAEINSSESSTRASASASPSGSQVDSPVWWPALQGANMSDWAICIMLV